MEKIILPASVRTETGKKAATLRAQGIVPVIAYGHGTKPSALKVEAKILERVYAQAGGAKLVGLTVDEGRAKNVLIHDVQLDAKTGAINHADFYVVRMDEALKAEVPLHFVGESTAVYQEEGTLVRNVESVEIECLPGDLPESIEVDIAVLDDFEKTITAADLVVPKGVKLLIDEPEDLLIAKVEPPRSDDELAELDEAVSEELPESAQEETPVVVKEENEGDMDRRDKK